MLITRTRIFFIVSMSRIHLPKMSHISINILYIMWILKDRKIVSRKITRGPALASSREDRSTIWVTRCAFAFVHLSNRESATNFSSIDRLFFKAERTRSTNLFRGQRFHPQPKDRIVNCLKGIVLDTITYVRLKSNLSF